MLLKNVLLYSIFTTTSTDAAFQKSHFFAYYNKTKSESESGFETEISAFPILHRRQMFWIPSPFGEKKGAAPFLIKALSLRGALPQTKLRKK